ncbi:uncharacterized protein LOC123322627 [Coccinella septempunctata]|uniref:uncharacterized protein LOC123322627 n=1 Tax=Coccinella septempunctata TaxID=41139 RepID=UPI001D063A86|nr:uncharacterized protein LOC123322627 [Coccinella septempunctata]
MTKEEIEELKIMYSKVWEAFHAYTLIDLVLRWWNKQSRINITVTSPKDSKKEDGSIVVFLDYRSKAIVPFSLDKSYKKIHEALLKTQRISHSEQYYFLNICESYKEVILDAITSLPRTILFKLDSILYVMSILEAKSHEVSVPGNTYVNGLTREHSKKINELWPHNFENSDEFITVYIEQNGGYGLFNKDNDELLAWAIQGHLGHINLLQTAEEHRGKGYGKVMLQIISRHIAESGCVPIGSVLVDNIPSIRFFEKLGFKKAVRTNYIFTDCARQN